MKPIEWTSALAMSKKAAPYIGDVLEAAFAEARAIVVLITPDDLATVTSRTLVTSRETIRTNPDWPGTSKRPV